MLFAIPTYAFVASIFALIGVGRRECARRLCPQAAVAASAHGEASVRLTLFVVLRAFASGSTALTGVEAIANGVNAFRRPHGRTPPRRCSILGAIAIAMFVGVSWLAVHMHARPSATGTPSVLSEIARARLPVVVRARVHVLGGAGPDARRARARGEHVVPGLPAARRAARARPVLRAPVHEPRRPARLLERHRRPDRLVVRAPLDLRRERRLADPPVRDRRLHGVHALAGGDGPLLAADARHRAGVIASRSTRSAPPRPGS